MADGDLDENEMGPPRPEPKAQTKLLYQEMLDEKAEARGNKKARRKTKKEKDGDDMEDSGPNKFDVSREHRKKSQIGVNDL